MSPFCFSAQNSRQAIWKSIQNVLCCVVGLIKLITRNHGRKDEAGKFSARLLREIDSLWLFLEKGGVSPTNNHAERMLRFAVCWRKRSYGNVSEKGHRFAERILSLRQTCRLRAKSTFTVLVEALDCYFKEQKPDLSWISRT